MKKLAAVTFFLLLSSALAGCQSRPTPTQTQPVPTQAKNPAPPQPTARPSSTPIPPLNSPNGPPLRMITMFTPADGWGLISDALLLTHDGGDNWFSVPTPGGQVMETTRALFIDLNTLYLVLPAPDGQTGQLFYTSNGGGSWRVNPVPFLNGQLAFVNGVGLFVETRRTAADGMTSTLFTSRDNGLTWERTYPGADQTPAESLPESGLKTGMAFISPERGWVGVAAQHQKVVLYKTEDSGRSWALQDIPIPENITSLVTTSLPPIFFAGNPNDGFLPVDFVSMDTNDRNRVFYSTRDGGASWSPGASIIDGEIYTFIDPKTGWVWGKRGLYFTGDSAQTWDLLPVAFGRSERAFSLSFVDKTTGWLLTSDAKNRVRIYATRDGGNTWTAINP